MKAHRSNYHAHLLGILWRSCRRIEPDDHVWSAAGFLLLYIVIVVAFGAIMSGLAGMAVAA